MKIVIQIVLLIVAGILAYLIYNGIQSKIEFRDEAEARRIVVQKRLENVVKAQKGFKNEKGRYAANFDELVYFLKNDSLSMVKAIGNVPDSLTEMQAIEQGIVTRDTSKVPATSIFKRGFAYDSLRYIPFSGGKTFKMKADQIEKNKINVNVFEASATLGEVYTGLKTKNENIDNDEIIKVGSLEEPITTGNW